MTAQTIPQTIGRYVINGELGRGAMGVVYKASDPTIGRTVALKTMRLDVHGLDAGEMVRRFKNEARAAGVLNHPNIVTIYDAGEHEGILYIAMEFIEGTTLQALLEQTRILDAEQVLHFAREVAKGLDYAHAKGIVHRDVKPANIMITAHGGVKIMDFGIAKAGGSMTSTGQVLGTPNYMSPEQVKGRPLDGRADLFSFGVMLYEMMTGEKPFAGQNVTTIIYKIVNETPASPRDLDVSVHPGVSAIAMKALAKSPDERYQSGADLVRDLENYKRGGVTPQATAVLPATAPVRSHERSHEKTIVMPRRDVVAGSTVRIAEPVTLAPVRTPVPVQQKAPVARSSRNRGLIALLVTVLLFGAAAGGYAYYHTRAKMQQLEAEVKADDARVASSEAQQVQKPSPVPSAAPTASPAVQDPAVAPDTAQNVAATDKTAEGKSPFKPKTPVSPQSELTFIAQPDGVKVAIDGKSDAAWITPFKVQHVSPGTHNIVFSKSGYIAQTKTVHVSAGRNVDVSAELNQAAKVLVGSNPHGGSIWVDGKDSGMVTPAQLTLESGQHQISVKVPGYKDSFWEGTLTAGQTANVSPILLSSNQGAEKAASENFLTRFTGSDAVPNGKGLVHIRTVPEGATIVVNGRIGPLKTNARWPAPPGVYSIELQKVGYKPVHRNVQVQQGKVFNIDEILEKQ
jgi:serine/threonine-protein kinase